MYPLYVFIDESGNFDFSRKGTAFYVITAVITHLPTEASEKLSQLKYNILTGELFQDLSVEYKEKNISNGFHATEDKQVVRDEVFKIITGMEYIKAHSIVIRKNRTNPSLRSEEKFYSKMTGYLLDYIQKKYKYTKLCVIFNGSPTNSKKKILIKSVKSEIALKNIQNEYQIYFPNASTERMLDVADYISWAIYVKWERSELRGYTEIQKFLGKEELDIFVNGDREYY